MKLAIVGSGPLAGSNLVKDIIAQYLARFRPEIYLLPGHAAFNALVRVQASILGLSVVEMHPPRPFWIGKTLQSVRKRLVRGFYAKTVAKDVDIVLAFRTEGHSGSTFAQLVEEAPEAVVLTLRAGSPETVPTSVGTLH